MAIKDATMPRIDPIYIGANATAHLLEYCCQNNLKRFTLIADTNTYAALGQQVESALKAASYAVATILLSGTEVVANEHYIMQVLVQASLGDCTFIAVGSGTLTDITRFVSHRTGRSFIAMPTAPSVDGFTSIGAPIVLAGVKTTVICQPPLAVFADLDTLAHTPHRLVAAGFGDMLGKITSLADWKLGSLLWHEPFDEAIYTRSEKAIEACIAHTEAIGAQTTDGIRYLMDALIESGLCMLDFGSSRPASGAEHHASHYWEMKLLQEQRPALLHGAKVGFALTHVAAAYARLRELSRQEVLERLETAVLPSKAQEIANIRAGYGTLADNIIQDHAPFLDLTEVAFDAIKRCIVEEWDAIQAIASHVPPPEQIKGYLQQVGAATEADALGLSADEVKHGFEYGHYLRNRFTILKLNLLLDLPLM